MKLDSATIAAPCDFVRELFDVVDAYKHSQCLYLLAKLSDINMFAVCGTRQRTAEQFGELFAKTKFDLFRISPTPENRLMVLEAAPA